MFDRRKTNTPSLIGKGKRRPETAAAFYQRFITPLVDWRKQKAPEAIDGRDIIAPESLNLENSKEINR